MGKVTRILLLVLILSALASAGYYLFRTEPPPPPPPPPLASILPPELKKAMAASLPAEAAPTTTTTPDAQVRATFMANGQDQLMVKVTNSNSEDTVYQIRAGQVFEGGPNTIVTLEPVQLDVKANGQNETMVRTAALRLDNEMLDQVYRISPQEVNDVEKLIAASTPETEPEVLQTAILLVAENPELESIASFKLSDMPAEDGAFKVGLAEILRALKLIQSAQIDTTPLLVANDERLKTEALVNRTVKEEADEYFGITQAERWAYWQSMLTEGDPRYRHYALFGIGRQFPDIALEMMPKWIQQSKLPMHYRTSAIHALAQTHRQEAAELLNNLNRQMPEADAELKEAFRRARVYLRAQLEKNS